MGDWGVDTQGFDSTIKKLGGSSAIVFAEAKDTQRDVAGELKDELVRTSPEDTGTYKGNWHIREESDAVYIVNDTPYWPYLVLPNSKFQGSPSADDPGRGIIHNVRGIVHKYRAQYEAGLINKLKNLFR